MRTKILKIDPSFPETEKIAECAKVIRSGGLAIFPTETVYGIAANLNRPKAIKRLRAVKRRKADKPFSVLIAKKEDIANMTPATDTRLYKIIDKFWPGPLTVIVPSKEENKTVGLRMPQNAIALALVQAADCPVAAPSANRENEPPPSTCQEALKTLNGLVEIAIDGGPADFKQASTVVDMTQAPPKVLRQGPISPQDIEKTINRKVVLFVCTGNSCRSVMAEYLLKKRLAGRDDVEVISAGTSVFVSLGASESTMEILKKEGLDASLHQARSINPVMLKKADLIFVMTRAQRQTVIQKAPSAKDRVYLLKEFTNFPQTTEEDLDLPDPMGRPFYVYEECLEIMREAIEKIVKLI